MRKYLPYSLILIFPYTIVFALISIFTGICFKSVFNDSLLFLLSVLIVMYVVGLVCAIALLIKGVIKKGESREVLRINMIIKLIHIPAYLLIFGFGLLCMITIFTAGVTIVLIMLDIMAISLSGLIGLGGVIRSLRENKISIKKAVIHGILQFVYCADIISAIVIYRTIKAIE